MAVLAWKLGRELVVGKTSESPKEGAVFRGGINVRRPRSLLGLKRFNATIPLGRLRVGDGGLSLWSVPRSRSWTLPSVDLSKDQVRVRCRRGILRRGIEFRTPDEVHYFWTFRPNRVMAALRDSGYSIVDTRQS